MKLDESETPHLRPWLVRTLEPVCDAEPGALSEYVLALLRMEKSEPEMRKELAEQLEEFLEKSTGSFIDTLMLALRSKSYLPYSETSPEDSQVASTSTEDNGIPIPLNALVASGSPSAPMRGHKRGYDDLEGYEMPMANRPRLGRDGQFRRGNGMGVGGNFGPGGWNGQVQGGPMAGGPMNGTMQPQNLKRGVCRDYFNKGFCAYGDRCKYSHGDDAIVPGMFMNGPGMQPSQMPPFIPMFPNGGMPFPMGNDGSNQAYDPHEARMDMRPPNRGQRPPRIARNGETPLGAGELPVIQDLTPRIPGDDSRHQGSSLPGSMLHTNGGNDMPMNGMDMGVGSMGQMHPMGPMNPGMMGPAGPSANSMDVDVDSFLPRRGALLNRRGGGGRGGRGGQRGQFNNPVDSAFGRDGSDDKKTLVVEKIPEEKLSLESMNEWFKRFGTVTNVAIEKHTCKALVSFETSSEANAAFNSAEAVFNNRFVKLYWHRPRDGHGGKGAKQLADSAAIMKAFAEKDAQPAPSEATKPPAPVSTSAKPESSSTAAKELAAKQKLLEERIAEQKALVERVTQASGQEKKDLMAQFRKLNQEIKASESATPISTPPPRTESAASATADADEVKRQLLDKELDLHGDITASEASNKKAELEARLAKLRSEAASLGIPGTSASAGYRPYRGRGRPFRGSYRGGAMRGGPPNRASMKLDNRPKKLLIKGATPEHQQALHDWFEPVGMLDSVEKSDGGDFVASFKTRTAAEQALAQGSNIPSVGPVQLSWYSSQPTVVKSEDAAPVSKDENILKRLDEEQHPSPQAHVEEEQQAWPEEEAGEEDSMGLM